MKNLGEPGRLASKEAFPLHRPIPASTSYLFRSATVSCRPVLMAIPMNGKSYLPEHSWMLVSPPGITVLQLWYNQRRLALPTLLLSLAWASLQKSETPKSLFQWTKTQDSMDKSQKAWNPVGASGYSDSTVLKELDQHQHWILEPQCQEQGVYGNAKL